MCGMAIETWLWPEDMKHDSYVMLLIHVGNGEAYGITFAGQLAHPTNVAQEFHAAQAKEFTSWKRIT